MAKGGIIAAIVSGVLGYSWAMYKDNLNPVAGLGLVVLCTVVLVIGAFKGIFKKQQS